MVKKTLRLIGTNMPEFPYPHNMLVLLCYKLESNKFVQHSEKSFLLKNLNCIAYAVQPTLRKNFIKQSMNTQQPSNVKTTLWSVVCNVIYSMKSEVVRNKKCTTECLGQGTGVHIAQISGHMSEYRTGLRAPERISQALQDSSLCNTQASVQP